jgi:ribosomal protein S12 methylthiotransferase
VRYFLDSFGCAKNQVDSETMMALLNSASWDAAADPGDADLIIINSCGFIQSAKEQSLRALLTHRKAYPDKKILFSGCLAQRYGKDLSQSLPEADMLIGNQDADALGKALAALFPQSPLPAAPPPGTRPLLSPAGSGYVKISEGCNNRCAFCAIPRIRGPLISRPIPSVLEECAQLLSRGIKELCLVGQDAASYGAEKSGGGSSLPALLKALSGLAGPFWARVLYIHPDNFPLAMLELFQQDRRFLPYFDLPFQHGSGRILRAMNRRGDRKTYLALIDRIRSALPDAVIRSTFLTGFPGERERDFQALLDFQKDARLDWAGCFAYSREEDTPAYTLGNRVPQRLALARKSRVEARQVPITEQRLERFIGRAMTAIVEAPLALGGGKTCYLGRLFCHAPEVDGGVVISSETALSPGSFVETTVTGRSGFDLTAAVR